MIKRNTSKIFRLAFYSLLLTVYGACSEKSIKIPEEVIRPDTMATILSDIHMAQAAVSVYSIGDTVRYSLGDYIPAIFKNHHTSQRQFDSSLKFYSANPELLDSIYKQVLDELSRKEGEVEAHVK